MPASTSPTSYPEASLGSSTSSLSLSLSPAPAFQSPSKKTSCLGIPCSTVTGGTPPAPMAKGGGIGKLGKLKCMIKRWHAASAGNHNHHQGSPPRTAGAPAPDPPAEDAPAAAVADKVPFGLHPVYVGKSRRRYLVSSHLVDHPLFRVLVQRSGGNAPAEEDGAATVVGCEVVLFEHLLWMLENADPQSESLDELVEFYAC